jgi:N-acetylglucosamine-6-phosphate deacetylase
MQGMAGSWLLAGGRVVTPDGVLSPGWIAVAGTRIDAVGPGDGRDRQVPGVRVADLGGQWVLPGFVDMHVHGGGGASFTEGTGDDARTAAEFHRRHGSTTIVASLVTAPLAELEARAAMLAGLADAGIVAGVHLEGPFLAAARRGAHDPAHLLAPDVAVFDRLRAAAGGHLLVLTLAPELPGAAGVIAAAARAGVTVAVGHTDATAEVTAAAIAAGATHATHLFNAMRPLHHREPGAAGALLDAGTVSCEVIADGVHLHDVTIRLAARAAGRDRLVLVTDAMAAAGLPDGSYRLGSRPVTVAGGVARLAAPAGSPPPAGSPSPAGSPPPAGAAPAGPIAGSTATMADVVRHAVAAGLPVADVAAAASTNPARVLGLGGRTGAIRPGLAADLVACDEEFRPRAVMADGRWLTRPRQLLRHGPARCGRLSPACAPSRPAARRTPGPRRRPCASRPARQRSPGRHIPGRARRWQAAGSGSRRSCSRSRRPPAAARPPRRARTSPAARTRRRPRHRAARHRT